MAGAAEDLPDPAIAVDPVRALGYTGAVVDDDIVERIRTHVRTHAVREGRVASPWPQLSYYRVDAPVGPKRVETPGLALAVIADRSKTIELPAGETLRYTPGSYLFVTRETRYTSRIPRASAKRPYLSLTLHFDPEVVLETLLAIDDEDAPGDDSAAFVDNLDEGLAGTLVRLLDAVEDPVARRVVAPLAMREMVYRLLRTERAGPLRRAARADDPRIREAMRTVRERPAEAVSVEALARRVAMSPSHFAHRFREIARMTPMRFVKNVRLGEARLLMVRDGMGAAEAALEVGYASPSHFTRDFKAHYGAPPAAYAREMRERVAG